MTVKSIPDPLPELKKSPLHVRAREIIQNISMRINFILWRNVNAKWVYHYSFEMDQYARAHFTSIQTALELRNDGDVLTKGVETLGIIQKKGWGTYYLRDERTGKLVAHKIWPDKTKFPTKKEIPGHLRLVVDNTSTIAEVSQASR